MKNPPARSEPLPHPAPKLPTPPPCLLPGPRGMSHPAGPPTHRRGLVPPSSWPPTLASPPWAASLRPSCPAAAGGLTPSPELQLGACAAALPPDPTRRLLAAPTPPSGPSLSVTCPRSFPRLTRVSLSPHDGPQVPPGPEGTPFSSLSHPTERRQPPGCQSPAVPKPRTWPGPTPPAYQPFVPRVSPAFTLSPE